MLIRPTCFFDEGVMCERRHGVAAVGRLYPLHRKVDAMTTETLNRKRFLRRITAAAVAGAVLTGAMVMPSAVSADSDGLQRGKLVQLLAERYGEASVVMASISPP